MSAECLCARSLGGASAASFPLFLRLCVREIPLIQTPLIQICHDRKMRQEDPGVRKKSSRVVYNGIVTVLPSEKSDGSPAEHFWISEKHCARKAKP